MEPQLRDRLKALGLPTRAINAIVASGLTWDDIVNSTPAEIMRWPGISLKTMKILSPYNRWSQRHGDHLERAKRIREARAKRNKEITAEKSLAHSWRKFAPELVAALKDVLPYVDTCNSEHREARDRAQALLTRIGA